jgi:hypothetical protein
LETEVLATDIVEAAFLGVSKTSKLDFSTKKNFQAKRTPVGTPPMGPLSAHMVNWESHIFHRATFQPIGSSLPETLS